MNQLFLDYWPACIIGTCLTGFTIDFVVRFLVPGFRLKTCLRKSVQQLRHIRLGGPVTDLDEVATQAMPTDRLQALWHEYAKTLHPQRAADAFGQQRVVRWRAAALAEVFFTDQGVIEAPLATEYFGHLPGILTGMGIIGTFSGLIRGLLRFGISTDSHAVEQSLRHLMKAVGEAFVLSSTAIVLAITLTWLEKMMMNSLSGQLADLQQAIDALFATGADAEYLDRIMKASETSATQAVQLKDALVSDLRQILTDITSRQLAAAEQQSSRISGDLGRTMQETLAGTLAPIAQAVSTVGQAQGEAVHRMLTDVLAAFSAQIRDSFGGEMAAMQQLLEGTKEAMQATAARLDQLTADIAQAGRSAAHAMAEQLTETVAGMHARQDAFQQGVVEMLGASAASQQEQAGRLIDLLSAQLAKLLAASAKATETMQATVSALSVSTAASVNSMQQGAGALGDASHELARVATRAADAMRLASGTSEAMREAADSLVSASVTTGEVSADYARTRELLARMITEFHTSMDNGRRESGRDAPASVPGGIDRQESYRLPAETFAAATALRSSR